MALTLLKENSFLRIKNVGLNKTRIGFYELLKKHGAKINFRNVRLINNETVGDIEGGETPKPKYIEVNVKDTTYWTTGELLAMAQDCEKVFGDEGLEGVLSFHGKKTMVSDLWDIKEEKLQKLRPPFEGYYE